MSYNADLNSELKLDPAGIGYAAYTATNNDEGVALAMNTATAQVIGTITRDDLAAWSVISGMHGKIVDFSVTAGHPLRDSALSILSVLNGGAAGGIDMSKAQNVSILDGWQAANVLSDANRASFMSFATKVLPRSVALFGHLLSANEIAWAVRDSDGNSLLGN